MRLTFIFLTIAFLQVSAKGFSQTVTYSGKDVKLETVLNEIKKQTGVLFFYTTEDMTLSKPVTITLTNTPVEEALRQVLANQPLSYIMKSNTVFIKARADLKSTDTQTGMVNTKPLPPVDITGRITNAQGEPLSGASVIIKRTGKGHIAEANGNFKLKNVNADDIITISFTGYKTLSIKVGDRTNFAVVMDVTDDELDKVQVQAYGKTSRRFSTSDITTVTAEEIEKQPVMNPLLVLEGKVPGLNITETNGYASAPVKVELRGRNMIGINPNSTFPSDPLYIIDGVPLTVLELNVYSSYQTGSSGLLQNGLEGPAGGQSPLFSMNPADIESMEVLKDADATAIYGSRGANGVILITTKRGKAGKIKLDVHVQEGISRITKYWQLMNTQQYLAMRREALNNDGITPSLTHGDYDLLLWDTTRSTDWQRAIYDGTGKTIDAQTSLSGGNAQTSFRLGAGYDRTTNIVTVSGADQRGSIALNLNHHSLNQRLGISLTSNYSITKSDMVDLPSNVVLPPDAPSIYDSLGNLNFDGWGGQSTAARRSFNFGGLRVPYTAITNFLNSSLTFDYQIIKDLLFSTNFGYSNSQVNQQQFFLIASQDPLSNPTGNSNVGYNNTKNWIIEPQVSYTMLLGKGKISVLLGGTMQQTHTTGTFISGYGFTSDNLIQSLSNAASTSVSDNQGQYKYLALYGRISYNWQNKYILNLNARRDGSSRFGPNKQYGNFGSIGAAWIFTEENWVKRNLSFLSFGKLRGNYGATGSDAIGDYEYLSRWSSPGIYSSYNGSPILRPIQLDNPYFQWQVNKKLEAAVDLGILKDRIILSIDYYRDRCGNQLVQLPISSISGFVDVVANSKALVQNEGWEISGSAKIIQGKIFSWSLNANLSVNRNRLLAYPNIGQSPFANSLVVGQPLNIVHLLHYTGVDPLTGEYSFVDKNHDGIVAVNVANGAIDDSYAHDLSPKYFGGAGMNFSYKRILLSLFFNYKKQIGKNALYRPATDPGVFPQSATSNQAADLIGKEWQKPGDMSTFARFSTTRLKSDGQFSQSDGYFTDASFIRLSNLSISYSLPASWVKKAGMQSCSVFFHTNDLFVITKYKGLDPETQNFGAMPPSKTIVGGINFNF